MIDDREMSDVEFEFMMDVADKAIADAIQFANSQAGRAVAEQYRNSTPMKDYSGKQWYQLMEKAGIQ